MSDKALDVSRETHERLTSFAGLLMQENQAQNLISRNGADDVWTRHILDSLQLADLVDGQIHTWLDIGSGGGLPGLVLAIARPDVRFVLSEPRRLRADFLTRCCNQLGLVNVSVAQTRVERMVGGPYAVISARAVADLGQIFGMAHHLSTPATTWLLPKGRAATSELESARRSWQGRFRIAESRTDASSGIVIAQAVEPRTKS